MARRVLKNITDGTPLGHALHHDLESLAYVLMHAVMEKELARAAAEADATE